MIVLFYSAHRYSPHLRSFKALLSESASNYISFSPFLSDTPLSYSLTHLICTLFPHSRTTHSRPPTITLAHSLTLIHTLNLAASLTPTHPLSHSLTITHTITHSRTHSFTVTLTGHSDRDRESRRDARRPVGRAQTRRVSARTARRHCRTTVRRRPSLIMADS